MSEPLTAMPYMGGKSTGRNDGNGEWIASLLPPVAPGMVYAEPFAGMLGILLQRPPAPNEIVNDLDGRVINWWRCVRDEPDEFARLVALTPHSRSVYEAAERRIADDPSRTGMTAALDFTIVLLQSLRRGNESGTWGRRQDGKFNGEWSAGLEDRIAALSRRLRRVQFECGDAVPLIRQIGALPHAVYCDPPYADVQDYAANVDGDALREALSRAQARVAVSGYGGEWDSLGWRKEAREAQAMRPRSGNRWREALWMNYEPEHRLL